MPHVGAPVGRRRRVSGLHLLPERLVRADRCLSILSPKYPSGIYRPSWCLPWWLFRFLIDPRRALKGVMKDALGRQIIYMETATANR